MAAPVVVIAGAMPSTTTTTAIISMVPTIAMAFQMTTPAKMLIGTVTSNAAAVPFVTMDIQRTVMAVFPIMTMAI